MNDKDVIANNQSKRTKCTVYTRVMGYHRPVETFNIGKQGEFTDRVHFEQSVCKLETK